MLKPEHEVAIKRQLLQEIRDYVEGRLDVPDRTNYRRSLVQRIDQVLTTWLPPQERVFDEN
jgi:hypothetical protein